MIGQCWVPWVHYMDTRITFALSISSRLLIFYMARYMDVRYFSWWKRAHIGTHFLNPIACRVYPPFALVQRALMQGRKSRPMTTCFPGFAMGKYACMLPVISEKRFCRELSVDRKSMAKQMSTRNDTWHIVPCIYFATLLLNTLLFSIRHRCIPFE